MVDLPTPPLPDATAMIDVTPGTSGLLRRGRGAPSVGGGPAAGAPAGRALRGQHGRAGEHAGQRADRLLAGLAHRLQACASAGWTSIAKPTLPFLTTTPEIMPSAHEVVARGADAGFGAARRAPARW